MKMRLNRLHPASSLVVLVAAIISPAWPQESSAQTPTKPTVQDSASVIEELLSTPDFGIVYIADGAGDGSVLNETPAVAVKKIVALQSRAIPLLIAHLDDARETSAKYKGGAHWGNPIAVPVGYLCLDILSQLVVDNEILFIQARRDCDFDGMGACIQPKYYFNPDDYSLKAHHLVPDGRVLAAKRNWQRAYKTGMLKFRFPSWLARFSAAYSTND
jgi:hypothetical protein